MADFLLRVNLLDFPLQASQRKFPSVHKPLRNISPSKGPLKNLSPGAYFRNFTVVA